MDISFDIESVALTLKNNYDNMCNEMNHFAKHVIITGGSSNSDLFMQNFADSISTFRHAVTPLTVVQVQSSGINTAVGLGAIPGLRNGC